ncbi:MAG: hypothetical protein ACOC1O_04275 [bacterium]
MIENYIFALFTQTIPESLAFSFTIAVFLKVKLKKKSIILIGLINGFLIYNIRLLPITFGFHTLFSLFIITILIYYFYNENILLCFTMSLKVFIILTLLELFYSFLILSFTDINLNLIMSKSYIKTLVMLPQTITLFLTGLLVNYIRKFNKGDDQ